MVSTVFNSKRSWFNFSRLGILNTSRVFSFEEFREFVYDSKFNLYQTHYGCRWLQPGKMWFKGTGVEMMNRLLLIMAGKDPEIPQCTEFDFMVDTAIDPNIGVLFNGEIMIDPLKGINCFGSAVNNLNMRQALSVGKTQSPLVVRACLGDENYEKLIEILEAFSQEIPQVVEFSQFTEGVGVHHETLMIWEIRNY